MPQPNVSSGPSRSITVTACDGIRRFMSSAKYSPAGPPPRIVMRIQVSTRRRGRIAVEAQARPAGACRRSLMRNAGLVERFAVPELARDLLVHLVEPLAVVGEAAAADLAAAAEAHLQEPVGIGQRLARRADDVRGAGREDRLRPASKVLMPPATTTGVVEAGVAHRRDGCGTPASTLRPNGPASSASTVGMHSQPLGPV